MKFSSMFRRGFTLIELLIVIVIIGILSVGLVPKVLDAPKKARDTVRKTDLNSIKIAVESYYADTNGYPDVEGDFTTPKGLDTYFPNKTLPIGPNKDKYLYYRTAAKGCYILGADMESAKGGNVDNSKTKIGDLNCTNISAQVAGAGDMFYIAGGSD